MHSEKELLGIIAKQREHYADAFVKFSNVLRDMKHYDLARAALRLANNYGILADKETEERVDLIIALGHEDVCDDILSYLRSAQGNTLSVRALRDRVGAISEWNWRKSINKLIADKKIEKIGNNIGAYYKLLEANKLAG